MILIVGMPGFGAGKIVVASPTDDLDSQKQNIITLQTNVIVIVTKTIYAGYCKTLQNYVLFLTIIACCDI